MGKLGFAVTSAELGVFITLLTVAQIFVVTLAYPVTDRYFNRAAQVRSWWNQRLALHIWPTLTLIIALFSTYGTINLIYLIPLLLFGSHLAVIDAACHRLPNILNLFLLVAAIICLILGILLGGSITHIFYGVLIAAGSYALLLPLTFVGQNLGMGDVKLIPILIALTTAVSWHTLLFAAIFSVLGLGIWAIILVVFRKANRKTYLAVGPWVLLGTYLALLIGS